MMAPVGSGLGILCWLLHSVCFLAAVEERIDAGWEGFDGHVRTLVRVGFAGISNHEIARQTGPAPSTMRETRRRFEAVAPPSPVWNSGQIVSVELEAGPQLPRPSGHDPLGGSFGVRLLAR